MAIRHDAHETLSYDADDLVDPHKKCAPLNDLRGYLHGCHRHLLHDGHDDYHVLRASLHEPFQCVLVARMVRRVHRIPG